MGRFDEFIDEFVFMAKSAADVASKKTGEVVEISKLKYQAKQADWDLERAYAKLGALVYESKRSTEDFTDAILLATNEIDGVKEKIAQIEDSMRAFRKVSKCEKCGTDNDITSAFCAHCGAALVTADAESEEADETDGD